MDADTGRIVASVLTASDVDDASRVGSLLDQVEDPIASFTADGAYDQDGVHGEVAARHPNAAVIVPPRSSAVLRAVAETALTGRDQHLRTELSHSLVVAGTNSPGQNGGMTPKPATYPGYRFPAEIIEHAIWLYHLFSLSLRDIALILAERGVVVSYESIHRWCLCFGADFAAKLRKRRPRPGGTWHLDEVLILSANSCGVSQCCEPRHARLGSWYAIKPSHHAGHIDCSRRADFL